MTKLGLLSIFFSFGMVLTAQISVPEVQKSLYGVVEATWCGSCGQYGIPVTENVINQTGNKAVFLGLHQNSNSALYSPTAASIANSIGTSGQPYWTLNGTPFGNYNSSIQNNLITAINSNYNPNSTDANVGYNWSIANDTVYVETLTKFFTTLNGDYYLALYVVEDNIFAYQANYDPMIPNGNIYHNHILRTSFSSNAFGTLIATGTTAAGTTISASHKLRLNPGWDPNQIYLVLVLWKDNGSGYDFVNANSDKMYASVFDDNAMFTDFEVYPNPVDDQVNIYFNNIYSDLQINIHDVSGKIVYSQNYENDFLSFIGLDVSNLSSGIYSVSVSDGKKNVVKKLLIR